MVKVYFETTNDGETSNGCYAELVAIFEDEQTYKICLPALETEAKSSGFIVTESVEGSLTLDEASNPRYDVHFDIEGKHVTVEVDPIGETVVTVDSTKVEDIRIYHETQFDS